MKKHSILFIIFALLVGCTKTPETAVLPTPTALPTTLTTYDNRPDVYETDPYAGFASSSSFMNNGADYTTQSTFDTHTITIVDSGPSLNSILFSQASLYLGANKTFNVSFDISSSVNKTIEIQVVDSDNQKTLFQDSYQVSDNHIQFQFTTGSEISYTGALQIALGGENLKDYTVEISNILVRPETTHLNAKVNQIGYLPSEKKYVSFSVYDGDYFELFDATTDEAVYRGTIVNKNNDTSSKEIVGYGDFSDFNTIGQYYIVSQYGATSYPFVIDDNIYDNLLKDSFYMISSQRCGYDLSDEIYHELAHPSCHLGYAEAYGFSHQLDTSGGWHDAGDYGKYVATTAKTTIDLMMTYLVSQESFDDSMGILESGNQQNDLLDELKVGVDFLLRLQRNDGGIYHKVVSKQFANFVLPENDIETQFAMNVDTASTAFSGALFAIASELFLESDPQFSETLKNAALKADEFMSVNNYIDAFNPEEFGSGIYRDSEDVSERYLLSIALWYMTNDQKYLDQAWAIKDNNQAMIFDLNYNNPSMYANFLYAFTAESSSKQIEIANTVISYADNYYNTVNNDPYFITLGGNFGWGSNYVAANHAMMMLMGYTLNNDYKFIEASYDTLHYFLGRNALNQSFITNNGDQYPKNIHHRFTITKSVSLPGALVGGPNAFRNDPITERTFNDATPASKSYIDHQDSYSTNEVAIYYNSPLVFVLATLDKVQAIR